MVGAVLPVIATKFPDAVARAESVEWWAHKRSNIGSNIGGSGGSSGSGHQLHYDLGEKRLRRDGKAQCPLSCVIYVEEGAHPTIMPSPRLRSSTSRRWSRSPVIHLGVRRSSWRTPSRRIGARMRRRRRRWRHIEDASGVLCSPVTNRMLVFDGSLLHGVMPARPSAPASDVGPDGMERNGANDQVRFGVGCQGRR